MGKTDRFFELYNDLDSLLRERYHEPSRTVSVILRFCNELNRSGNPALIKMGKKLNMVRLIRNDLIHEFDNNSDNFLSVNDDAIEFLEKVVDMLRNPRTAKDLYTPINKLYTVQDDDNVKVIDIITEMRKRGHSQAPVVDKNNVVKGVFSPNVLFAYFHNNPSSKIEDLLLKDIRDYLPINSHFSETYEFISVKTSETDIDNMFVASYGKNRKLALVFVTRSGNPRESLLGIIVLADVIKDN